MQKRFLTLLIDIPLLAICMILILNNVLGFYLNNELKRQVEISSQHIYKLEISSLKINIITGSLTASNVMFGSMKNKSSSFYSKEINISNLELMNLFIHHKINVGSIEVAKSIIEIKPTSDRPDTTAPDTVPSEYALYDLFKSKYSSVFVKTIDIENPDVRFYKNSDDSTLFLSSKRGRIHIENLLIDSSTSIVQKRNFNADEVDVYLMDIKNIIADSLYTLYVPSIYLSYTNNKIEIDSLTLSPNYSKKEFSKKAGKQVDRFIIFSRKISIEDIDVKTFMEKFKCYASKIRIDSLNVNIYRNKYVTAIPEQKKFLQEIIQDLDLPLKIKELNIKNSYLEYNELVPPSSTAGKIAFNNVEGSFKNVTNMRSDSGDTMYLKLSAKLFNTSPVLANIYFPNNRDYFYGTGTVRRIAMKQMNSMLESTAKAVITDGFIDSMKFVIHSDKRFSSGSLEMVYHDLRVAAKNIAENDTAKLGLKVKSFIANNFIIKKSNPEKNEKIRVVPMSHEYNNDKFIVNNLWKTLLSGIKKSIGLPGKE